ncbi:GumC family protein [Rhizobium herbae]
MTTSHTFHGVTPISLSPAGSGGNPALSLSDIVFFLKTRWLWIVITTMVFTALAGAYLLFATPTYVASTQLLIFPQANGSETQRAFVEDTFLEGQLEIAKSNDVLSSTAKALDLISDPEFSEAPLSYQDIVKAMLLEALGEEAQSSATPDNGRTPEDGRSDRVISKLRNMTTARRIGRSTIIELSAAASSAAKAEKLANTMATAYIVKNISMKAQFAQQYSDWLEKILREQQRNLTEAANDLASFRTDPRDQYRLAELQSQADARRTLFENTLTQFTEAKQRISSPVSDATIVSPATPPLSKARPRSVLIIAFAIAVGFGAGLMLAMIRHASDRRIIRRGRLVEATGLPFVTSVKKHRTKNRFGTNRAVSALREIERSIELGIEPVLPGIEELTAVTIGLRRKRKIIIGIVAVDPGCGASTIACELAVQSAASGSRTLLIDTVVDGVSLSHLLVPCAVPGLADVLDDVSLLKTAALRVSATLKFLPVGRAECVTPAIRLSSGRTQLNFTELKKDFDAIFVDITAFSKSSDATAIASELDGILLVICHGRTTIDEAARAIESLRNVGAEVVGAIINKVPVGKQP